MPPDGLIQKGIKMAEPSATAPTAAAKPQAETKERRVSIKLFNDVWIDDPGHPEATPDGVRRIRTNIVRLNEDGSPQIDRKSRNYISDHTVADVPLSVAKKMLAEGKAERMDPL